MAEICGFIFCCEVDLMSLRVVLLKYLGND